MRRATLCPPTSLNHNKQKSNEGNKTAHLGEVVLPDAACDLVATEIKGLEVDARHLQLLARGELRRRVRAEPRIFQHVHQRRLARIVEALRIQ